MSVICLAVPEQAGQHSGGEHGQLCQGMLSQKLDSHFMHNYYTNYHIFHEYDIHINLVSVAV